ncbi:hypothetical protein GCM10010406_11420 [Streptomyces thermolineatus]|uniref:Uncharacterized protein n=1 Tax=Streptomyces thermolineatus TaxID=44033 RepID=A0ABN3L5S8_9ACTN
MEEISLLRGVEEGDWTAVAPVMVLPSRVILTCTGPYCVLTVAPVTDRVVDPPEVASVVLGAAGAVLVLTGAAVAVRDAGVRVDADALAEAVVLGLGDDGAEAVGDSAAVAEAVGEVPSPAGAEEAAGVPGAAARASEGSVVGLSASSSTMTDTVPAPARTARRSGCVFLTFRSACPGVRALHPSQKANDSWWIRRSGTPASRRAV